MLSCGILETPRFGRKSNFMFTPGAIITFECNEGFFLQGDRRRTCGLDGNWDIPEYGYTECLRESIIDQLSLLPKFIIPYISKNEHLFSSHAYNDYYLYPGSNIFFWHKFKTSSQMVEGDYEIIFSKFKNILLKNNL